MRKFSRFCSAETEKKNLDLDGRDREEKAGPWRPRQRRETWTLTACTEKRRLDLDGQDREEKAEPWSRDREEKAGPWRPRQRRESWTLTAKTEKRNLDLDGRDREEKPGPWRQGQRRETWTLTACTEKRRLDLDAETEEKPGPWRLRRENIQTFETKFFRRQYCWVHVNFATRPFEYQCLRRSAEKFPCHWHWNCCFSWSLSSYLLASSNLPSALGAKQSSQQNILRTTAESISGWGRTDG